MRAFIALLLWTTTAMAAASDLPRAAWAQSATEQNLPQAALLSIGVAVFEVAPRAGAMAARTAAVEQAEARFLPWMLRQRLEQSQQWGPARLLPAPDVSFELNVTGTIVASSARRLALAIKITDATGSSWLERNYAASAAPEDYENPEQEPFSELYDQVVADMVAARANLTLARLQEIGTVARLRYAASLLPEATEGYLKTSQSGQWLINRLPARQDPLWARIDRVRQTHELFTDVLDQQYLAYGEELAPTYNAWRRITLRSQATMSDYRQTEAGRDKSRKSAQKRYNDLREAKLYEQTLRESIGAFAFEVGPTTLNVDGEVVELTGSLNEQMQRWQSILSELYAREVGI